MTQQFAVTVDLIRVFLAFWHGYTLDAKRVHFCSQPGGKAEFMSNK